MSDYAQLAEYRRTVAEMYAAVRANPNPADAALKFRAARDALFRDHPLSALTDEARANFGGLPYAPYDPAWRILAPLDYAVTQDEFSLELPEGSFRYQRFARAHFTAPSGEPAALSLYWVLGYGGGVFLPFGDATNNHSTYGGGRYLYDTIKGADLGISAEQIILDFNFAYHPSCFYSPRWVCPLTLPENRLPFAVPVGEMSQQ